MQYTEREKIEPIVRKKVIKMNGLALGRPKEQYKLEEKKEARENEKIRNKVEGKLGEGKRNTD